MDPTTRMAQAAVRVRSAFGTGSGAVYELNGRQYIVTNNHVIFNEKTNRVDLVQVDGEFYATVYDHNNQPGYARLTSHVHSGITGGFLRGTGVDLAILEVVKPDAPEFRAVYKAFNPDDEALSRIGDYTFSPKPYSVTEVKAHTPTAVGDYIVVGHPGGAVEQYTSTGRYRFQAHEEDGSIGPVNIDNVRITSFLENGELARGISGSTIGNKDGIPIAVISHKSESGTFAAGGTPIHHAMDQIIAVDKAYAEGYRMTVTPDIAAGPNLSKWSYTFKGESGADAIAAELGLSRELKPSPLLQSQMDALEARKSIPSTASPTAEDLLKYYVNSNDNDPEFDPEFRMTWAHEQFSDLNYSLNVRRGGPLAEFIGKDGLTPAEKDIALVTYIAQNDRRFSMNSSVSEIKSSGAYLTLKTAMDYDAIEPKTGDAKAMFDAMRISRGNMQQQAGNAYQVALEVAEVMYAMKTNGIKSQEFKDETYDLEALTGVNFINKEGEIIKR